MEVSIYIVTETFKEGARAYSDTHVCYSEDEAKSVQEYLCREHLASKKYKDFKDGVFSYTTTRWSYDISYCRFTLNIAKETKK